MSGETAQVAVKVYGNDLDTLDGAAANITTVLSKLPGIVDRQFKRQTGTPSISIEMQPQTLAASGLKVQDVLETIEAAYAGATVGQTFQGTRTVSVAVLLPQPQRDRPDRASARS